MLDLFTENSPSLRRILSFITWERQKGGFGSQKKLILGRLDRNWKCGLAESLFYIIYNLSTQAVGGIGQSKLFGRNP